MKYIINGFRGFCMALADSVPGVSGGTIAFILGFYDQFVASLNDLIYGTMEEKKKAFFFLMKLGIGWIIGMILAVLVLTSLFEAHIYEVSSLFMGFIIFAIPLVIKEEKESVHGKYKNILFLILGILIVSLITYFNPVNDSTGGINLANLTFGTGIYLFICAMIAISAMILPGISGSTLLLIFGLYIPVMEAIKNLLHFKFDYLLPVIIFGLGILTGVILIIKLIKWALQKYRSAMIYLILGLMIGSLYAIVMGPTTLDVPKDPLSFETFSILFFILGCVIMIGLEKVKKILENKKA